MPLYLVRWPDLTASLVRAADEEALIDCLDEVADPGCASWSKYDGPVWVEFSSPLHVEVSSSSAERPLGETDVTTVVPDDFPDLELGPGQLLEPAHGGGDTYGEMLDEIAHRAFPHVAGAIEHLTEAQDEGEPLPREKVVAVLRDALSKEVQPLVQYSWRWGAVQRRGGLEAKLGVTVPISPLRATEDASEHEPDDEDVPF